MLLSILIPVRDDRENLRRCLESLRNQKRDDCEILVCDDGSSPPLSPADMQFGDLKIQLFRREGGGPAAARNFLARKARGRYLLFLDADTAMLDGTLAEIRRVIADHPGIRAFFGSYDDEPLHTSLVSSYKNLSHHHVHQEAGSRVKTFWCGLGVVDRILFIESGGLSESYRHPSIEDVELGMRLARRNVEIFLFPHLQVKHLKKWSLRNWLFTDLFRRGIPWVRLMRSRRQWPSQLNFTWTQRLAAVSALTIAAALLMAPWLPSSLLVAVPAVGLFIFLNRDFLTLVARKKGVTKALQMIPLQFLYSMVCVLAFVIGILAPRTTPKEIG